MLLREIKGIYQVYGLGDNIIKMSFFSSNWIHRFNSIPIFVEIDKLILIFRGNAKIPRTNMTILKNNTF